MPMSPFLKSLRDKVGGDLLVLPAVTTMLFDAAGRLLLAQEQGTGLWMTIGGAIDPDESPADAAVRETFEETGLFVELVRIIGVFGGPEFRITYPNGHMVSYTTTAFEARAIGGTAKADGEEATALRYVSREEAALLPMGPWTRILTEAAFQRREGAVFAAPTWTPGA